MHTLDTLSLALKGFPRTAPMLVRLPDGTLHEITHAEVGHLGQQGSVSQQAVVLVAGGGLAPS